MLEAIDILEIQMVVSLYGHIIDNRQFSRVAEVFTDDVIYDLTDFDGGIIVGADTVARLWAQTDTVHPLAHHATNVVVWTDADGVVRVNSKGLGVGNRGRVGSVNYDDVFRKVNGHWRMAERVCRLRRATGIPEIS